MPVTDFSLLIMAFLVSLAFVLACAAIFSKDLLKAVVFSAVQVTCYVIIFFLLRAPDVMLVYFGTAGAIVTALLVQAIAKTKRHEEEADS